MASQQIAHGAVVITANADQMTQGLQSAEKKVRASAQKMTREFKEASASGGGGFGADLGKDFAQELGRRSFLGGLVGGAAGGGAMGFMSELIANSSAAILEMATNSKKFNIELQRSAFLSAEIAKSLDRAREDSPMSFETATNEYQANLQRFNKLNQKLIDFNTFGHETWEEGMLMWIGMGFGDHMRELEGDLKQAEVAVAKYGEVLHKINKEKLELEKPWQFRKENKDFQAAMQAWDDRSEFAFMDEDEKERMRFLQRGADDRAIAQLKDKQETARRREAEAAQMKELEKFGGGGAWLSMVLSAAGAAVNIGRNMPDKPTNVLADAVEAGTKEAYSVSVRNQFKEPAMDQKMIHERNGQKIDAVKDAIDQMNRDLSGILGKFGVV